MKFPLCLALILLAFSAVLCAQNEQCCAIVGITGHWEVIDPPPSRTLKFADTIKLNTCVAADEGSLVILLKDPVAFVCEGEHIDPQCRRSPQHPCVRFIDSPKDPDWKTSLSAAIMPLIRDLPNYITPVSRGLEPELADTVLLLQSGQFDVAHVLERMPPATYRLRVESITNHKISSMASVEWKGSGPADISIPEFRPGLYQVVALNQSAEQQGLPAWILLCTKDTYTKAFADYTSALETTDKWPDETDPRAARTILRAYLDLLSRRTRESEKSQ